MSRWLVTGGSGFVGRAVLEALSHKRETGAHVVALGRRQPSGWPAESFFRGDLEDAALLSRAVRAIDPQVVIHAAGKTPPAPASVLYRANTRVTANLLAAMKTTGRNARIVIVGSAAELGPVPVEALPVDENYPCHPVDAYGLSKWAATRLAIAETAPLEVIAARVFNAIGPGLSTHQAFGRFASLLATPGPDPLSLSVGRLDSKRDFIDVRDVAEALIALADHGQSGKLYNVGTGHSRSIGEGLDELVRLSGRKVQLDEDAAFRGPADSRADISRIVAETGWSPQVDWKQSLGDLWDEGRTRLAGRRVA